MNKLNISVTLVVSFLTSLTTAVVCVLILATSSVEKKSIEEVNVQAKPSNTTDLGQRIAMNPLQFETQEKLNAIATRLGELEKNVLTNAQELLVIQQTKLTEPPVSSIVSDQATVLSDDSYAKSDDSQAPLSDEQAQLGFEDAMILFELEDIDDNATSQLALNLEGFSDHSQSMGIENLAVQSQECRGQFCRVELSYQGESDALRLLPALLAAETTQSIKLNLSQVGEQTRITALMR